MKMKLLKIVNPILALLILDQLVTVILLKFSYSEIVSEIHEWNGIALFAVISFHIFLNWAWIRSNIFSKKK